MAVRAAQKAGLVFFESWVDPIAEDILGGRDDVDLRKLSYSTVEADNWDVMSRAHGYQVQARTELREPWFPDAALIARCPNLLAASSTGAGYDYIDVEACTAAGILVCNQGGTNTEAVAEHALGLMLSLSKRIGIADKLLRRHGAQIDRYALQGNDIRGKTVGIVGLGAIGGRLAELCHGLFGMTVLAYDPYLDSAEIVRRHGTSASLVELLQRSDFVSVHCPRSKETLGMFGEAQFAAMKPSAYFINTARGGIHDEPALETALRERRIAGAGIDVFLKEPPPPDHPLLSLDNVIATPHTAGITQEALEQMSSSAADQWIELFNGRAPPRVVNPQAWPAFSRRFASMFGFEPEPLPYA
ncbi:hydroxyacid dehydrogenase [Bosea sp. SSUT16]|uniref:Hydroxyacid dehydrogenase n=1 Tax=Bosea spartocytisi TaxID=2773451 RepID=A0A927I1D4_9HYPH|nr:hydroxyacid dehydrogenase [Bosea spartocytisi]MBD3847466.1 hydroxyacid dehydrogenase [Bosea spartocytisi]MCT4474529.1 hydroxyacid dehydrogenase [Bosea spartocytisi]